MTAEDCCDTIVQKIKSFNLHYQFEENPFSIQIKIRKKFIENKVTKHDLQTNASEALYEKLRVMEETLENKSEECKTLKEETNHLKAEVIKLGEELHETKLELTNQYRVVKEIKKEKVKQETHLVEELNQAEDALNKEEIRVNDVIVANKKLYKEILNMKKIKGSASSVSTSPNNSTKPLSSQPGFQALKENNISLSLGSVSKSVSTFQPSPIKYHPWNNTPLVTSEHSSMKCNHSPQCTIRQPRPPPLPSVTFLVNHQSKYHEHILTRAGVPGCYGGHSQCFSIDNANYGCEDCVWLKWHGDLHGYPDINPWDFKKYLAPSDWPALGLW